MLMKPVTLTPVIPDDDPFDGNVTEGTKSVPEVVVVDGVVQVIVV